MNEKTLSKKALNIFYLCLFAGVIGIIDFIYSAVKAHAAGITQYGLPSTSLLIIALGIAFIVAFKSTSFEKAINQISALKIISLVLVITFAYNNISYIINIVKSGSELLPLVISIIQNISFLLSSLAILLTSITLPKGDLKRFNISTTIILVLEIFVVLVIVIAGIFVSELHYIILASAFMIIVMPTAIPKLLKNKIIKGALIGGIIAGDTGAVVGAIVASNNQKQK